MFSATHSMQPGPLAPFMRGEVSPEMQEYVQRGREALMHQARDAERWMEDNTATVCIAGLLLGTFVDRRFLLVPLALGGIKLWRALQTS